MRAVLRKAGWVGDVLDPLAVDVDLAAVAQRLDDIPSPVCGLRDADLADRAVARTPLSLSSGLRSCCARCLRAWSLRPLCRVDVSNDPCSIFELCARLSDRRYVSAGKLRQAAGFAQPAAAPAICAAMALSSGRNLLAHLVARGARRVGRQIDGADRLAGAVDHRRPRCERSPCSSSSSTMEKPCSWSARMRSNSACRSVMV